jgi:hypothetical protein
MFLSHVSDGVSELYCSKCDQYEPEIDYTIGQVLNIESCKVSSTQHCISQLMIPQNQRCNECFTRLQNCLSYNEPPKLLILEYPHTNIKTNHNIKIKINNHITLLHLKGIVYHGENHFTSRIISRDGRIHQEKMTKVGRPM